MGGSAGKTHAITDNLILCQWSDRPSKPIPLSESTKSGMLKHQYSILKTKKKILWSNRLCKAILIDLLSNLISLTITSFWVSEFYVIL